MNIEGSANLLGVKESTLTAFDMEDVFNDNQRLEGHISRQSDHRYGAMVLWRVGDRDVVPQAIYATPKLHYPFTRTDDDETRKYRFPTKVQKVEVYDKLDGTNVCCYPYRDADGNIYSTFKTRLVPVLSSSRFGPFRTMWEELMGRDPGINFARAVVEKAGEVSFSFEMYGYRNAHLISYKEPLEACLLFGVVQSDAEVLPASYFHNNPSSLKPVASLPSKDDLVAFYEGKREEAEARNVKFMDGDDDRIDGTEGFIFYVMEEGGAWRMFKCKPASVEAMHWVSNTVPLSIIMPTVWNYIECGEYPTVDGIKELLREEFAADIVNNSHARVEKAVTVVTDKLRWREKVQATHQEVTADGAFANKGLLMREMSKHFDRSKMASVFTALRELGLTGETT